MQWSLRNATGQLGGVEFPSANGHCWRSPQFDESGGTGPTARLTGSIAPRFPGIPFSPGCPRWAAAKSLSETLTFAHLTQSVISTVTGEVLSEEIDIKELLLAQITQPVQFLPALTVGNTQVDLWLEVGPGHILSHLAKQAGSVPSVALDSGGQSLAGLLQAIAAVFSLGGTVNLAPIFQTRFSRPLALGQPLHFFQNPCELAPDLITALTPFSVSQPSKEEQAITTDSSIIEQEPDKGTAPLEYLRQLVAQRTELPLTAIADHHRLLSDLHLNSITVGQLVSEAAQTLGLQAPHDPTAYANASLAEMAIALTELSTLTPEISPEKFPAGVAPWLRVFALDWQPETLTMPSPLTAPSSGQWEIVNLSENSLPENLATPLQTLPGKGLMVILPAARTRETTLALLEASQRGLQQDPLNYFVLLHSGWGGGFARTLHLENPSITTCVLELPLDHPQGLAWLSAEIQAASGFVEARYDAKGQRYCPYLQLVPLNRDQEPSTNVSALTAADCLLVTGGGKGIAAESALAIAQRTGVMLVLLGRSEPTQSKELAQNLERMGSHGIEVHYFVCDVGDRQQVQQTLQTIEATLRPITAILHGAGVNHPRLITQLTPADFDRTVTPKVTGLNHILGSIPGEQLKQVITFGSIIARTGLPGEADYALANEELGQILQQFQQHHPHCQCLNLEWSVWSGTGMGERLGRIDSLAHQGITPITPDQGVNLLNQLMTERLPSTSVVVTSRFGSLPTLRLAPQDLPLWRFLEQPRVFYPGVELVVDVELSLATDPYLKDHVYQGELIFPGVMGLESMTQVAKVLAEDHPFGEIDRIRFHRPIVMPATDTLTIRIAAISRTSKEIEVVIRSAQTGFAVEHFQATYRLTTPAVTVEVPHLSPHVAPSLEINPHLYGELLFHQGRFRRIQKYHHLTAKSCIAEIQTDGVTPWFSSYLPQTLVLGDSGARDAAIHALQACVPHATILPIGIESLRVYQVDDQGAHQVTAIERAQVDDQFIYDLWINSANGDLIESWQGLALQIIQPKSQHDPWSAPLLPPYLERCLTAQYPQTAVAIALTEQTATDRRKISDQLLTKLAGGFHPITRRTDGKPDPIQHQSVSVSHCENLTLAISQRSTMQYASHQQIACDLERVTSLHHRPWQDLLGKEGLNLARLITQETADSHDVAATRIWAAQECLKKVGISPHTLLTLGQISNSLVWLESHTAVAAEVSSPLAIATWVFTVHLLNDPLVIAILTTVHPPLHHPSLSRDLSLSALVHRRQSQDFVNQEVS